MIQKICSDFLMFCFLSHPQADKQLCRDTFQRETAYPLLNADDICFQLTGLHFLHLRIESEKNRYPGHSFHTCVQFFSQRFLQIHGSRKQNHGYPESMPASIRNAEVLKSFIHVRIFENHPANQSETGVSLPVLKSE